MSVILLILLLIPTVWLRLVNLGYSDFQGDEIKALFLPATGQSIFSFLMDQRKGPLQFLITAVLKFADPQYTNQYFLRLPFAIAGILAVYFFYKLISREFGEKIGFYSSMFFALNGFFIAFSRIVQYQSFVILFMVLSLYMFSLSSHNGKYKIKGLYLGFIFWALSILSHYDGVFIAPFAIYLIYSWYKRAGLENKDKMKHLIISLIISGLMLMAFYIPFVLSLSKDTLSYWQGRLEGTGGRTASSSYLFRVYNPNYTYYLYILLGFLGGISLLPKLKNLNLKVISLLVWVILPVTFMEFIVEIPGTHIFTYLLPLTVILGFGVFFTENVVKKFIGSRLGNILCTLGIGLVFIYLAIQSHLIFVDHNREFPWESKQVLIWNFVRPNIGTYQLSLFGFPYYRHWEEVKQYITSQKDVTDYSSNERKTISHYYLPYNQDAKRADFYIQIKNPQSYINESSNSKINEWAATHDPDLTFYDSLGRSSTLIYKVQNVTQQ